MNKDLFISVVSAIAAVNPEGFTVARVYDVISFGRANAVGGWLDSESGLYYYDAVVVLQDREKAIEVGRLNDQLAIFDLNTMEEIRL